MVQNFGLLHLKGHGELNSNLSHVKLVKTIVYYSNELDKVKGTAPIGFEEPQKTSLEYQSRGG